MRLATRHVIALGAWGIFALSILLTPGSSQDLSLHAVLLTLLLMLPVFLFVAEGVAYVISFATRNNAGKNEHFDKFSVSIDDDEYEAFKEI